MLIGLHIVMRPCCGVCSKKNYQWNESIALLNTMRWKWITTRGWCINYYFCCLLFFYFSSVLIWRVGFRCCNQTTNNKHIWTPAAKIAHSSVDRCPYRKPQLSMKVITIELRKKYFEGNNDFRMYLNFSNLKEKCAVLKIEISIKYIQFRSTFQ